TGCDQLTTTPSSQTDALTNSAINTTINGNGDSCQPATLVIQPSGDQPQLDQLTSNEQQMNSLLSNILQRWQIALSEHRDQNRRTPVNIRMHSQLTSFLEARCYFHHKQICADEPVQLSI